MDMLDLKDRLNDISTSISCISGLLAGQKQVPVTGGELASVLSMFQSEIENIEQNVINLRFPAR